MREVEKSMKYVLLMLVLFAAGYLAPLDRRPLATPDEFRYAEIPREMIASGDYTTPRLLDMRYFEKPVLGYWLNAGAIKIFGDTHFAIRFFSALAAGLTALLVFGVVHQSLRDRRQGALAGTIYLCCGLVYAVGTFSVLDSQLTFFATGTLFTAFLATLERPFSKRRAVLLFLCGAFAGLGFLTKGFVAWAAPGIAMTGYLIWEKRWKEFLLLPWIPLLVAVIVAAPWALAIHRAEPDYWRYFIMVEHFQRFSGSAAGQHPKPFWFFLPLIVGGAFPAAVLAPTAFAVGREWKRLLCQPLYRLCVCAVVLPLLFFSLSNGKLATYILPCFPPLAVLIAAGVVSYFRSGGHSRTYHTALNIWAGILIFIGVAAVVAFGLIRFGGEPVQSLLAKLPTDQLGDALSSDWKVPLLAVVLLASGMALFYRKREWRPRLYAFFGGIGLIMLSSGIAMPEFDTAKMPETSLRQLPQIAKFDPSEATLVTVPSLMHAVAWVYNRADIKIVSDGELEYGNNAAIADGDPGVVIPPRKLAAFAAASNRPVVGIFRRDDVDAVHCRIVPKPLTRVSSGELVAEIYPFGTAVKKP